MKKLLLFILFITIKQLNAQCLVSITPEYNIICSTQSDQLIASGATSYSWQPSNSIISTSITGDTVVVSPYFSTTYTVTALTGTCITTNTIAITVNNCTQPYVVFSENTNITCVSHCINFKDSTQYTSTRPLYYKWVFVGGNISFIPGSTISGDTLSYSLTDTGTTHPIKVCYHINSLSMASGYYPVTEIVSNGLGQTSSSRDSVKITPSTYATFNLVQDPTPYTWDVNFNYTSYSNNLNIVWYWGDGTHTNAAYPSHTYSAAGRYNISVSIADNVSGCKDSVYQNDSIYRLANNNGTLSNMIYVNVKNAAMGISQISSLNTHISIYPNPSNGNFSIETNATDKQTLQVYDVNGRIVLTQPITGKTSIDACNLLNGIYNVSVISGEGVVNKRLVIKK